MRILVHHHKYGDIYYGAEPGPEELWAFQMMFEALDEFEAYCNLEPETSDDEFDPDQLELYKKAKKGDSKAAKKLCQLRKEYEYEGFSFDDVLRESGE